MGGVDRDILSTPSGSEHAFILGAMRVATGRFRTQLVVAWCPTEASSIQEVEQLGADPYFHRALPLDELSAHALQAGAVGQKVPRVAAVAAAVLAKDRRHGAFACPDPPVPAKPGHARWPLEAGMTTILITGCVEMVLATEDFIVELGLTNVAWIRGMGFMSADRVGIIGIGQSRFTTRRDDASYPDPVREAVLLAMNDAKLGFDDIEAVVYSLSPHATVGVGNAERPGVEAVGARNKRFLRINTDGATGISRVAAAYYHIASGACDVVLTAGADKVGDYGDFQTVLTKIWGPTYERQLALGTINTLGMSTIRYIDRYGMPEEDMARVTVKNCRQASLNPNAHLRRVVSIDDVMASRTIAWPIKLMGCCPQSKAAARS